MSLLNVGNWTIQTDRIVALRVEINDLHIVYDRGGEQIIWLGDMPKEERESLINRLLSAIEL